MIAAGQRGIRKLNGNGKKYNKDQFFKKCTKLGMYLVLFLVLKKLYNKPAKNGLSDSVVLKDHLRCYSKC